MAWLNLRVLVVVASLFVLVRLTHHGDPQIAIRNDIVGCAIILVAYIAVFLIPLWQTFGVRRVMGALVSIIAAWTAVALALMADAVPTPVADPGTYHYNWPMTAFCLAAAVAFYLFFDSTGRAFRLRREIRAIRGLQ